jgi:hypothetical protein
MELAGISRPRQIPVSNGYRRFSNGYRARLQYPMDTGVSPMDTGAERELATHCQDPLKGSFCRNSANPLVVKAEAIRSRSNYIEIKIATMQLQNTWKAHFRSLTTVNESGDRNIAGFNGAMDFEASQDKKMTTLNQSHGFLLAANLRKEILPLHNPTNFGGTLLRPTDKVGCLVGIGSKAIPVIVEHQAALLSLQVVIPSITDINACITIDELNALPTPPEIGGIVNLEGLQTFFPAPFL